MERARQHKRLKAFFVFALVVIFLQGIYYFYAYFQKNRYELFCKLPSEEDIEDRQICISSCIEDLPGFRANATYKNNINYITNPSMVGGFDELNLSYKINGRIKDIIYKDSTTEYGLQSYVNLVLVKDFQPVNLTFSKHDLVKIEVYDEKDSQKTAFSFNALKKGDYIQADIVIDPRRVDTMRLVRGTIVKKPAN
jgi:cbb3-type cytochrome oxidase subunit 3